MILHEQSAVKKGAIVMGNKRLTNHREGDTSPSWSSDGKKVAFSSNRELNGTIDEVRIYNRSLSAEQIAVMYQRGLAHLTGELAGIKVIKSSGHPSLDQGTTDAILAASPFPPLPKHFQLDRLNIRARFHYRLVAES